MFFRRVLVSVFSECTILLWGHRVVLELQSAFHHINFAVELYV